MLCSKPVSAGSHRIEVEEPPVIDVCFQGQQVLSMPLLLTARKTGLLRFEANFA